MFRNYSLLLLGCFVVSSASSQSISPSVIGAAGGSGSAGGVTIDWTVGELAVTTLNNGSNILTQGFHQGDPVKIKANIGAFLQGPYNGGLMDDGLGSNALIPLQEPYTALGYTHVGGGDETTTLPVLSVIGNDAIVDWVFLELRDKTNNTAVVATRSALVQRDGDIVDVDGTSPVGFAAPPDDYYLSVQHRNHLSILSFGTVALTSSATAVDFRDGSTTTFGTDAQYNEAGTLMLWAGDVTANGELKYIGAANDRDPILVEIGGSVPTATTTGYKQEDVNMDGTVKYIGSGNDRDPILVNVGGSVPTAIRVEQMP
jgi:hypothetical protein